MAEDRSAHWQDVYTRKAADAVSWFEAEPVLSLELLRDAGLGPEHTVVDIGGGASALVDSLVREGIADVAVLDLSEAALATARARLPASAPVEWIASDVTQWQPSRQFDFWHDRAAFHFLTERQDRDAYGAVLRRALAPGGIAVIGTFAPDGPERCSNLPVARYDAQGITDAIGEGFVLISQRRHVHVTPWGSEQAFTFATLRRLD